jgi:predicted DNA-binding protein
MTTITIQLPDTLQQRAEEIVSRRGGTVNELIQELLEEYLEEIEDVQEASAIIARIASGEKRTYSHNEVWDEEDIYPSLEEVVAKIKATPSNPANFHPATQSLAELLVNSPSDPSFDEEEWNQEWARAEEEIKAITRADDQSEGRAYSL